MKNTDKKRKKKKSKKSKKGKKKRKKQPSSSDSDSDSDSDSSSFSVSGITFVVRGTFLLRSSGVEYQLTFFLVVALVDIGIFYGWVPMTSFAVLL